MPRYTLYIGNKNYSSWSMRAGVLIKHFQLPFQEQRVWFGGNDSNHQSPASDFKKRMYQVSALGKVPTLVDHQQADLVITDSLAISEYLAEQHPDKNLWPTTTKARAQARAFVAEIHSGLSLIRGNLSMNIEASLPEVGQLLLRDKPELVQELNQFITWWATLLEKSTGRFLFGDFSIADAFIVPLCSRFKTYGISMPDRVAHYMAHLFTLPAVTAWVNDAMQEKQFYVLDEPYRLHR